MTPDQMLKDGDHRMNQAVEAMLHDFASYRTGRANPAVLDRVHVEYYGTETPVNQIANISIPEPRQLMITPYDKTALQNIERAIMKSDLGINPMSDGINIRLNFPAMTEERRKDMVKQVNARAEQACVAIRNVRRDVIEHLKAAEKEKEMSEDQLRSYESKVQDITDKHVAHVHDLQKKKDEELMEV